GTCQTPVDGEARAERKALWLSALNVWTAAKKAERIAQSMTRHDLKRLDSLGRLIAQRQSLIENLAPYYRERPAADVAPGLLALITFLSDNNDGCCTLSIRRMA